MEQIKKPHAVESLLDTDLYKFTMMQTVLHRFSGAVVEYHFRCRTENAFLINDMDRINEELDHICGLTFSEDELAYLGERRYFKADFVDFLRNFKLQRKYVEVKPSMVRPDSVDIIVKGPWVQTILFEIYILAIINQIHYEHLDTAPLYKDGYKRLMDKIEMIKNHPNREKLSFSDFGTRRRFNREWHYTVVKTLKENLPENFTGTSNLWLAKELDLVPIGTMAHEYLQACQVLGPTLRYFQQFAFEEWAQEYRGDLGIALTDVIGLDAFLKDFDLYFCKLFDGVRHDSGDPKVWGDTIIEHYKANRIDPLTKTFTFSDGLNVPKMLDLYDHFKDRCKPNFGIGTDLTNDVGVKALQVVLKMVRCNDLPVAKLSDAVGKTMSDDQNYVNYLIHLFKPELLNK